MPRGANGRRMASRGRRPRASRATGSSSRTQSPGRRRGWRRAARRHGSGSSTPTSTIAGTAGCPRLWTAYSHPFECFGISPILQTRAPTKRCGKSSAIVVLRHLCRAPLLSGNITPAALFRAIDAWEPTLLIDEAETFAKMNDELRGILNAGHTRDTAFVSVRKATATSHVSSRRGHRRSWPRSGGCRHDRGSLDPDLSVTRKPEHHHQAGRLRLRSGATACARYGARLARSSSISRLDRDRTRRATARPPRPRLEQLASIACGRLRRRRDWLARAEHAARVLTSDGSEGDDEDLGTLALQHVWEALEPAGRLATPEILDHLIAKDDGPWAKRWESQLARGESRSAASSLARLLRPFRIKPRQLWIDGHNVRGYDASDWRSDAVMPYLQRDPSDVGNARTGASGRKESSDHSDPSVAIRSNRDRAQPRVGDDGYLEWLWPRFEAGLLTEGEWQVASKAHQSLTTTSRDRR